MCNIITAFNELRHVNIFLWKEKFKYEDLRVAIQLMEPGDYMILFDLKSGYHHVDVHPRHWQYLGFAWEQHAKVNYFVFKVLPFGLSTACYAFTKLLRPLVRRWRSLGLRMVLYLDDGICFAQSYTLAKEAAIIIQEDLEAAGFVINVQKSRLNPSQKLKWLGFDIDLEAEKLKVPEERYKKLMQSLAPYADSSPTVMPVRMLASVIGQIISMSLVIGPIARLMTRACYSVIESRRSWQDRVQLTQEAGTELRFWHQNLVSLNGRGIWYQPSTARLVYSDASDVAFGGYIVGLGPFVAHGQWSQDESERSSTWRELQAVNVMLQAWGSVLRNEKVKWFTDSQNTARIISCGSRKEPLQQIALSIFGTCLKSGISLEVDWVPRASNEKADFISKIVDYDDWAINATVFRQIDALWGPHTVDRLASYYNAQLPRFNTRFWNPNTEAVDTFTVNWSGEVNWCCPPVYLVPRVIRHAKNCKAVGTLVVPLWPSSVFWPLLCPQGVGFAPFVQDWRDLPLCVETIIPGKRGSSLFEGMPNTRILALRFDFREPLQGNVSLSRELRPL